MSDPDREGHQHAAAALNLASYHRCLDRIRTTWPVFRAKRDERLKQQERHGVAAEKVAENILEDLFTTVLDWSLGDLNNQIDYADPGSSPAAHDGQLHPHKYKLPCQCFGYVGDASDPSTWKLPYCHADGSIDASRLPKAIQAILTNYRGATVHGIPEKAIPGVLARLEEAARQAGKMPDQSPETATVYHQLAEVLAQLRREIPR